MKQLMHSSFTLPFRLCPALAETDFSAQLPLARVPLLGIGDDGPSREMLYHEDQPGINPHGPRGLVGALPARQ